ncbi:50S ribosomal protein L21e [Candidatus Woesearchaeota archaeon]|nr:50S ribosomal protein L21e [Candidatus Woesearchaeota archaeon]
MVKKLGTFRSKTRNKLKKSFRQKGKIGLSKYFQAFKPGEKVALVAEPGVQKGMYHPRFRNRPGIVESKEGTCYKVKIKDRDKNKTVIVHPVHLKRL